MGWGRAMFNTRGGLRRSLRANRVNDDDDDQHDDDQADDQGDKKPQRGARRRIGCGGGDAVSGVSISRDRCRAPWVLQGIRAVRSCGISTGSKGAVHRDDLGDSVSPCRHRQGASLVGGCRGGRAGRRRLDLPFNAQGDRNEGEGRAEGLAIFGQGSVSASGENKGARVLESELGFVLRSGVHELHVTDRHVVTCHVLDVLIRRATRVRGACGFAHRARGVDDGQCIDELAVLG